jgi:hypothetical protein
MGVWEDYLLPLLTCDDAAQLRCTCKALMVVVREHFKDLGRVDIDQLQAVLTCFPTARSLALSPYGLRDVRREALVEWLRVGGRGGGITTMTATDQCDKDDEHFDIVFAALREGALPSLKVVAVHLVRETHRASLTGGLLGGMRELRLKIMRDREWEPQLAVLGHVRQLPALARLELKLCSFGRYNDDDDADDLVQWPHFIPPTLKALRILTDDDLMPHSHRLSQSLLRALPGMLGASGARLERLDVPVSSRRVQAGSDVLVHVAQALRCCSPKLKAFRLAADQEMFYISKSAEDYARRMEQHRAEWAELMASVCAFRELEVLVLPYVDIEPLFQHGTAFDRLTHLQISDHEREHPPDAGVMGLWELMASGGLPALAKLSVRVNEGWGLDEVNARVAPALEAVAGTLTDLHLRLWYACGWSGDERGIEYELGLAVRKLRRLRELALGLHGDGRAYHAFAQGVVAGDGGGAEDHACTPIPTSWPAWTSQVCGSSCSLTSAITPCLRPVLCGERGTSTSGAVKNPKHASVLQAIAQCTLVDIDKHHGCFCVKCVPS